MLWIFSCLTLVLIALTETSVCAAETGPQLPSFELQNALKAFQPRAGQQPDPVTVWKRPNLGNPDFGSNNAEPKPIPFASSNSLILQFQPNITGADVAQYFKENNFIVTKTFPDIGAVQVDTDLSRFFKPKETDRDVNERVFRGIVEASKFFKSDWRIKEATPDVYFGAKSVSDQDEFDTAVNIVDSKSDKVSEIGWGARDIEAPDLWDLPMAKDGVVFGILDVGFGRHDKLTYIRFKEDTHIANHGTHVAGIACARHDEKKGVRGIIPNCFVRARVSNLWYSNSQAADPLRIAIGFSQVLSAAGDFIRDDNEVEIFNFSLGYNWYKLGYNPDLPEESLLRGVVEAQAPIFTDTLLSAKVNSPNKLFFFAAGNDSSSPSKTINVKYASAFNWAVLKAREAGVRNGIIVEAHDDEGNRTAFSNVGGHVSCPGMRILSTVAFDKYENPSSTAFGEMQGTSMATPFCAASVALFKLVRPRYSTEEALNCILISAGRTNEGVPRPKLKQALDACP
jgi:subtilisin family serine protease